MPAITDAEIVEALKHNGEKGFRLLMTKYKEQVYWHIRRLVVVHDDAQDAAQETFIRVFKSIGQYRGEASLGTWIYRIATNEALRMLNQQRIKQALSLDDVAVEAIQLSADNYVDYTDLEAIKLQRAIHSLPTKQQLAFNLRYYDELPYEDIAQITGTSVGSVKANYHIAKEKVIKYMQTTL